MWAKNKNGSDPPRDLAKLVVSRYGEAFLTDCENGRTYSYQEFFSAALDGRDALVASGVRKGDTITFVVPNAVTTLTLYTAALLAGARVALIDPLRGSREIQDMRSQITSHLTIADASKSIDDVQIPPDAISQAFAVRPRTSDEVGEAIEAIDAESDFLTTFTSGTTGLPKPITHSFGNLYASARAFGDEFSFGARHVFYHHLPMTYMAGVLNSFVLPLACGSAVAVGPRFSVSQVSQFWQLPARYNVNVFWFVPTMLALLMKLDRGDAGVAYAKTRTILGCVGTAPLSSELHTAFEQRYDIQLFESYGLSETLFISTQSPQHDCGAGSVGPPLEPVAVSVEADGELVLTAPWMAVSPAGDEGGRIDHDVSCRSGDLGAFGPDGDLRITGRKKDLIIRGGVNISPRRLEEFIEARRCFDEVAIVGRSDVVGGEKIACFYVPGSVEFDAAARGSLQAAIKEQLGPDYNVDQFIAMQSIPKSINGKVDKGQLKNLRLAAS